MRILYIANVRLPTEKAHGIQIMKACEAFKNAGHDIELIVTNRRSPIVEDPFSYYGIKTRFTLRRFFTFDTVSWGSVGYVFESIMFGLATWPHIWSHQSDIIYGRDEIVLAVVALLNRPFIWESHDGAWNWWARFVAQRARGIVVVTAGAVDFYREHGIADSKLLAVSNGVDLEAFAHPEPKEAARNRLGLSLHQKIALYIGRLDGWKGTDTLLEASRHLPDAVRAAIIGGERVQIEKLSKKYPHVAFLGSRPYRELADNQAAADVLVIPNTAKDPVSVRFTSPLKLIAALASKRPIVAADLPSTRWIADGAAIFVHPDDPAALARGIESALQGGADITQMMRVARERAAGLSWDTRAQKVLTFISARSGQAGDR